MTRAYVIGVDPGVTTGIARLDLADLTLDVVQCSPGAVLPILKALADEGVVSVIAVERFVVGPRAARSSTPKAGQITRDLVGALAALGQQLDIRVVQRSAAEVMPWATDIRLDRAGLLDPCKGMPHSRDAVRHALYAAVSDAGFPDPLSSRSRSPR